MATTDNAMYGENARALGEARAMKPLMVLARSKNHAVHRNATWALACMTACERNHVPMRASIDTLLAVVAHGSRDAQRYAVMAVRYILYMRATVLCVSAAWPPPLCCLGPQVHAVCQRWRM